MYGRYAGRKFGRARHLLGFSRFLRGNAIGNGQEEAGADDIAQGAPQEVVAVAGEANSPAGRIEATHGQDGHIGHAVFKAAGEESVETPEGHDQFTAVGLAAEAAPDGQANEDVAEDAPQEEDQRRQAHLGGSGRR